MDNYPEDLAPDFDEDGAPSTPFDMWWCRVASSFPTVPEDVAKYWLYEHWQHSPFDYLPSRDYEFEEQDWPSEQALEIRSRWCNYSESNDRCRSHGEHILKIPGYRTAQYMLENGLPPARLTVLDNHDGHLTAGGGTVLSYEKLPATYVLIEGHRRFNISLALHARGKLKQLPIWLMKRIS